VFVNTLTRKVERCSLAVVEQTKSGRKNRNKIKIEERKIFPSCAKRKEAKSEYSENTEGKNIC
jgi:hypothetical protein